MKGKKVFVYWNLHKKMWSLKSCEGEDRGLVIGHQETVFLEDCVFKVSEAGRRRVLLTKRKNVHAGVIGRVADIIPVADRYRLFVTYNPYKGPSFVTCADKLPVTSASTVVMYPDRAVSASDLRFKVLA